MISMLKEFVFLVIVLSASVTWLTVFLSEKSRCLEAETGELIGKKEDNGEKTITDEKETQRSPEEKQDNEQSQVRDTCSALGRCLCSLGLCFFTPCTSSCCRFARGENPHSFTFYLSKGFWFFWRGFQLRFLAAFGTFSRGLVSLLSAPVQNEEERFFAMKASLTALWVPCIVGEKPHTFLITALVSRLVRTLALVATLLLYKFNFPAFLQTRTTLLFCAPKDTLTSLTLAPTCLWLQCFQFCQTNATDCLDRRFRECKDDAFFLAILASVLAFSSIVSLLTTLRLKQLANYSKLFQVSRTALPCCSPVQDSTKLRLCYPCCPFEPILHRSVIFDRMATGAFQEFSDMLNDAPTNALVRPNIMGETPIHVAAAMKDSAFLETLLRKRAQGKGADPSKDSRKQEDEEYELKATISNKDKNQTTASDGGSHESDCEEGYANDADDNMECKDRRGRSPMFNACEHNNLPALKQLLNAGFHPDAEDREGLRPIQVAMKNKAKDCVLHLLNSSEEVRQNTKVDQELKIMNWVVLSQGGVWMNITDQHMNWDLIEKIKNSGSPPLLRRRPPPAVTKEGHTPVDPVLDILVESLKEEADYKGLSVIAKAVDEGNAEQLELLLQAGVSPEIEDGTGVSPLQRAVRDNKDELCISLIDAGADYKKVDINQLNTRAVEDNKTELATTLISKAGANPDQRESTSTQGLIHIAGENSNWEILFQLLDRGAEIFAYEDSHTRSTNCQSLLVALAKANRIPLLDRLIENSRFDIVRSLGVHHLLVNHGDLDCLLRLERPELLPLLQRFASKMCPRTFLENYTEDEGARLLAKLRMNDIKLRGEDGVEVQWNQTIPPRSECSRHIWFGWHERSAYEERGHVTGVQVETDGELIQKIRFSYHHTFEKWRLTTGLAEDSNHCEDQDTEEDKFLLADGERIVEVTTFTIKGSPKLCGIEVLTGSGRQAFWGKRTQDCMKSVMKGVFLAYCSGGGNHGDGNYHLIFHWGRNRSSCCK